VEIPNNFIILYYSKTNVLNLNINKCGDYESILKYYINMQNIGLICILFSISFLFAGCYIHKTHKLKTNTMRLPLIIKN
jgi:hypothetical protein